MLLAIASLLVLFALAPHSAYAGSYCSSTQKFCVVGSTTANGLADFKITGPAGASTGWIAIGMGADSMPGSEIFVVGSQRVGDVERNRP